MGEWENGRMGKWALRLTLRELSEIKNQKALKKLVFQGYIFSIKHQTLAINHARRVTPPQSALSASPALRCK